jgi:hypothetical protein
VSAWASWTIPIMIIALIYILGGLIALLIDPNKRL